jgi:uncharacterized protein (DUF58 family)
MRDGDDPRDIYWRKSTLTDQFVLLERAHETRRDVELSLDSTYPEDTPGDAWLNQFERRIRDLASHAVAHLKRGDRVSITTRFGERARADGSQGADPLLRFLALLEPHPEDAHGSHEPSLVPPKRESLHSNPISTTFGDQP